MKKTIKSICILLSLTLITGLLASCANNEKGGSDSDESQTRIEDTTDETSGTTLSGIDPSFGETDETTAASGDADETTSTDPADTTAASAPAGTTAAAKAKTLGKVTVSDAYKKSYGKNQWGYKATVKIPKITIEGVSTKAINKEILNYCKKNSGNECSCSYSYYIGKTYVSILIILQEEHDMSPATMYNVYNISRSSGKKMSKKSMLKALGLSAKKFKSRVKKAITKMYKKDFGYSSKAPSYVKSYYKKAVSSKYLNKATPYVNSKGKVCYMIKLLPIPAGADAYDTNGTC